MAEGVQIVAIIIGMICFPTALIDMGMNGSRYAEWAPIGLTITFLCFAAYGIAGALS